MLHLPDSVNVIIVIGHEKLNVEMQRLFGGQNQSRRITVVKIPKSGGVRTSLLSHSSEPLLN